MAGPAPAARAARSANQRARRRAAARARGPLKGAAPPPARPLTALSEPRGDLQSGSRPRGEEPLLRHGHSRAFLQGDMIATQGLEGGWCWGGDVPVSLTPPSGLGHGTVRWQGLDIHTGRSTQLG